MKIVDWLVPDYPPKVSQPKADGVDPLQTFLQAHGTGNCPGKCARPPDLMRVLGEDDV